MASGLFLRHSSYCWQLKNNFPALFTEQCLTYATQSNQILSHESKAFIDFEGSKRLREAEGSLVIPQ